MAASTHAHCAVRAWLEHLCCVGCTTAGAACATGAGPCEGGVAKQLVSGNQETSCFQGGRHAVSDWGHPSTQRLLQHTASTARAAMDVAPLLAPCGSPLPLHRRHSTGGRVGLALLGVAFTIATIIQLQGVFGRAWHKDYRVEELPRWLMRAVFAVGHCGFAGRAGAAGSITSQWCAWHGIQRCRQWMSPATLHASSCAPDSPPSPPAAAPAIVAAASGQPAGQPGTRPACVHACKHACVLAGRPLRMHCRLPSPASM